MKDLAADTSGATAIEYALVAGLIAMVIVTVVASVGTKLSSAFYASMASAP